MSTELQPGTGRTAVPNAGGQSGRGSQPAVCWGQSLCTESSCKPDSCGSGGGLPRRHKGPRGGQGALGRGHLSRPGEGSCQAEAVGTAVQAEGMVSAKALGPKFKGQTAGSVAGGWNEVSLHRSPCAGPGQRAVGTGAVPGARRGKVTRTERGPGTGAAAGGEPAAPLPPAEPAVSCWSEGGLPRSQWPGASSRPFLPEMGSRSSSKTNLVSHFPDGCKGGVCH